VDGTRCDNYLPGAGGVGVGAGAFVAAESALGACDGSPEQPIITKHPTSANRETIRFIVFILPLCLFR
jgi:hypothetical protein